jgi:hypothetical protein
MFMIRGAYRYEKDIASTENSTTFYTGISAGATVNTRLGRSPGSPNVAIDYSFRPTHRPDNGVHMFSLRFMLHGKNSEVRKQDIINNANGTSSN